MVQDAALAGIIAMGTALSPALAGLGIGVALGSTPGPVQAVILVESVRGGVPRGFRAMAGATAIFGTLLASFALGLSLAAPRGTVLGALQLAGGAFLLWAAAGQFRGQGDDAHPAGAPARRAFAPSARGAIAVLLNPGAWLFIAAVASPLFSSAAQRGGTGSALAVAFAMLGGTAACDAAVVLVGGLGLRRDHGRARLWVQRALALVLAGFGGWMLVSGAVTLGAAA